MKTIYYWLTCLLIIEIIVSQPVQQPVIGIYTQDAEEFIELAKDITNGMSTYIAASYVKNIQMAGGQVVPLFYHYSYRQLEEILGKINGVFFPGTSANIQVVRCQFI
jgi:gamma-glutamyl-gamma-aminobutyrate hydrolase PuuD